MNYAKIKTVDIANGTGVRVSLFVSGCNNNCQGCFNKEAQDFNYGFNYTKETEKSILESLSPNYIEGLSLLGGEPFEIRNQEVVLDLVKKVKKEYPNKNIWCYSGFTIEELLNRRNNITDQLLKNIDVLVDGRFIENLKDPSLEFRGSTNQRIININEYFKILEKQNLITSQNKYTFLKNQTIEADEPEM